MFEFDQDAVDALILDSAKFRRLYDKYGTLKTQVQDANAKQVVVPPLDLEHLKKEKLHIKDRMAGMIKDYRQVRA